MRPAILLLALLAPALLARAGPGEAAPRGWQRAQPADPYEDETVYEPGPYGRYRDPAPPGFRGGPYGGGLIEMLMTGR
ncbi:MAG TPA: hypothetical protein VFS03_04550, partial [Microvirga sp.]|nr:hypothetical protein [Microvirga sp.]